MSCRSVVPKGGLEPPRVAPHAPQTCASANSATSAPTRAQYAAPARALSIQRPSRPALAAESNDAADARLAQTGVEGVADPLAHQVVGEHRDQDRQARVEGEPPGDLDVVAPVVQYVAPGGVGRLDPEAEKRETGLGEDGRRDAEGHRHQDGRDRVGPDGTGGDAQRPRTDGLRPKDEPPPAQGE